jgi:hypothetical protein
VKDLLVGRSLNGVALRCMHKGGPVLIHSNKTPIFPPARVMLPMIRFQNLANSQTLAYAMYRIFIHSQSLACIRPPPLSANTRVHSSVFVCS